MLLASCIVPVIVAVILVWACWRWAIRDEARHEAEREARGGRLY